jgi:hypothetical protein
VLSSIEGDPRLVFESCLDRLDAHGFDPSGVQQPDRAYFVSLLQWGHSMNVHIQSEAGDHAAVTVLNTLGLLTVSATYSPPLGASPPPGH